MGLVSSLLGAEKSKEQSINNETIERWRSRSSQTSATPSSSIEEGESVRLVNSTEPSAPASPAQEPMRFDSWAAEEGGKESSWAVDSTFLEKEREQSGGEKLSRWRSRGSAANSTPQTPSAAAPVESAQTPMSMPKVELVQAMAGPAIDYTGKTAPSEPQINVEEDLKRRFGGNIRSALGPGTVIEGKMSFDSPVRIDGTINGEVNSTSALIVGEQALVSARLKVGSLIVLGQVTGDVDATDLVEIRRGGQVEGDISTKRLVIEHGGFFEGRSTPL